MLLLTIGDHELSHILSYLKFPDFNRLTCVSHGLNGILCEKACQYMLLEKFRERKQNIKDIILKGVYSDETNMVYKDIYYDFILISDNRQRIINSFTYSYGSIPFWIMSFSKFLEKKI